MWIGAFDICGVAVLYLLLQLWDWSLIGFVLVFFFTLKVVQLGFFPDDPVETFQAPHWGILTLGHPHHAEVGAYGPLGPRNVNEVPQNHEPAVETQSPRSA